MLTKPDPRSGKVWPGMAGSRRQRVAFSRMLVVWFDTVGPCRLLRSGGPGSNLPGHSRPLACGRWPSSGLGAALRCWAQHAWGFANRIRRLGLRGHIPGASRRSTLDLSRKRPLDSPAWRRCTRTDRTDTSKPSAPNLWARERKASEVSLSARGSDPKRIARS